MIKQEVQLPLFDELVDITHMCKLLKKSRTTIWRWHKSGKLLQAVVKNNRVVGWDPVQLAQWQNPQGTNKH